MTGRERTKDVGRYGFAWGPMDVTRLSHIEGRGYLLEVSTEHAHIQIHVTEKGRAITVYSGSPGMDNPVWRES